MSRKKRNNKIKLPDIKDKVLDKYDENIIKYIGANSIHKVMKKAGRKWSNKKEMKEYRRELKKYYQE